MSMTLHDLNQTDWNALRNTLLAIADDKLMLGHINSDWTGLGPILEEDIASSSIAQDDLSHALVLYELIAEVDGTSADTLAYCRRINEYRCCDFVTRPDEFDWSVALVRQFLYSRFDALRLAQLATSTFADIAQRGERLVAEQALHVHHFDEWMRRLGHGDDASRARLQATLDLLMPESGSMFEDTDIDPAIWLAGIRTALESAGLTCPDAPPTGTPGGRSGIHAEHFVNAHTEMGEVRLTDPGASW
jgi:ring-1,2-phenylacetyl-CoA epoxidase subunit PaaC